MKMKLLGFLLSGLVLGVATLAQAPAPRAEVNVWFGPPVYGYWNGPGYYQGRYYARLSCYQGERIVDSRGFGKVDPIDCSPRYYEYKARRGGEWFKVRVDSRNGAIVRVKRY